MTSGCLFPLLYVNVMPKMKSPVVEQVFLIYRDGRLISFASINTDEQFDEDIVGSMLTAVMNFILYAFGKIEEDKTEIGEFKFGFGERSLLLEVGENFFIAIVIVGIENRSVHTKTRAVVRDIEEKYGSVLGDWPGDLDDFKGIDEIIITLLPVDDLSESERKAVWKEEIRERVFELWSSKYVHLLQKSLIPKAHLWKNLKLELNPDYKKGSSRKLKDEGSSEHKDSD